MLAASRHLRTGTQAGHLPIFSRAGGRHLASAVQRTGMQRTSLGSGWYISRNFFPHVFPMQLGLPPCGCNASDLCSVIYSARSGVLLWQPALEFGRSQESLAVLAVACRCHLTIGEPRRKLFALRFRRVVPHWHCTLGARPWSTPRGENFHHALSASFVAWSRL